MAIANIAAYTVIALSKLGIKFAENKKWLPAGYYHKKSVEQLKSGDIQGAIEYNYTAIKKNPESEKAQVVKELISMQQDSELKTCQRQIDAEEKSIHALEKELAGNIKDFDQYRRKYNIKQNSAFLLFVPILYSFLYLFLFETQNQYFVWLLVAVSLVNLVGFVVLSKTVLEKNRISYFLQKQEFDMTQHSLKRQLESTNETVEILKRQYKELEIEQRENSD